jgi:hypothetical protein
MREPFRCGGADLVNVYPNDGLNNDLDLAHVDNLLGATTSKSRTLMKNVD